MCDKFWYRTLKRPQEMLLGPKELVGHGRVRNVYFVHSNERTVVVKTLREVDNLRREKAHFVMHRREVLALDAVSFRDDSVTVFHFTLLKTAAATVTGFSLRGARANAYYSRHLLHGRDALFFF